MKTGAVPFALANHPERRRIPAGATATSEVKCIAGYTGCDTFSPRQEYDTAPDAAAASLDTIERNRVTYRNISASYTNDPDGIRHLLYATKEVLLPESLEHIAIDVIESLKSSTPEQDLTIVTAMHLMKIAYLLYKKGAYERCPGESEDACAAGEESEQKS